MQDCGLDEWERKVLFEGGDWTVKRPIAGASQVLLAAVSMVCAAGCGNAGRWAVLAAQIAQNLRLQDGKNPAECPAGIGQNGGRFADIAKMPCCTRTF
jgi:hypothetical protein